MLSVQQFAFVIDLACLASRREYLKLDKWLSDKIREHGENFVTACVKFLQVIYYIIGYYYLHIAELNIDWLLLILLETMPSISRVIG